MSFPSDRELIQNLYKWLYVVLNRLDQIDNPGIEPQWPDDVEPLLLAEMLKPRLEKE